MAIGLGVGCRWAGLGMKVGGDGDRFGSGVWLGVGVGEVGFARGRVGVERGLCGIAWRWRQR